MPDSVYWNIHMINTTDDTVRVTTVGTTGLVMSAFSPNNVEGAQSVVGRPEFNFTSLPFNPSPTVLAARTGVTLTVSMPVSYAQDCAPDPLNPHGIIGMDDSFTKDVDVTLVVTTTVGQYSTTPDDAQADPRLHQVTAAMSRPADNTCLRTVKTIPTS